MTHDARQKGLSGVALAGVLAASTLPIMSGAVIVPALNELRAAFDLGPVAAGALVTAHTVFIAAGSPLAGVIIDRVGARRPLIWGLVGFGLAGGAGALAPNLAWLLISRVPFGLATSFVFTAITVVILNNTTGDRRNTVMGWRAAGNQLGGIIYPTVGGFAAIIAWQGAFLVYLIALPIALIVAITLPRDSATTRPPGGVWALIRSDQRLQRLYIAAFSAYASLYVVVIFAPQLLAESGLGGAVIVGLYLSGMNLAAFIAASLFGRIRKIMGPGIILTIAGVAYLSSAIILALLETPIPIAVALAVFGLAHGLVVPSITVAVGNCAPPQLRGRVTSGLGVTNYLGQFTSPYLAAPLVAMVGLAGAFGMLGLGGLLVWVLGGPAAAKAREESSS